MRVISYKHVCKRKNCKFISYDYNEADKHSQKKGHNIKIVKLPHY